MDSFAGGLGLAPFHTGAAMYQAEGSGTLSLIIPAVVLVLGIGIGVLISNALRKSRSLGEKASSTPPILNSSSTRQEPARRAASHARRCPVCNSTYTDEALIYCVSDGTPLVPVINNSPARDPNETLLYRDSGNRDLSPTVPSRPEENQG
jgi:hypothetical protein